MSAGITRLPTSSLTFVEEGLKVRAPRSRKPTEPPSRQNELSFLPTATDGIADTVASFVNAASLPMGIPSATPNDTSTA